MEELQPHQSVPLQAMTVSSEHCIRCSQKAVRKRRRIAAEKREMSPQPAHWVSLFPLASRGLRAKYMAVNWHYPQNFQRGLFLFVLKLSSRLHMSLSLSFYVLFY